MEMNSLTKRCRICCTEYRNGLNLFGDEARRQFLQAKIKKYLSFTIYLDDKLPKMVCTECCLKLDGFHKFATMALRNQEKWSKYVCSNVNKYEEKETENKSLLHTYLTKGIKERDSESEVTELEVRVDPMTILQYCTDEDDENNIENKDDASTEKEDEPLDQKPLVKTENLLENENHNVGKTFLCQLCPRNFTSETALQMHMWSHPSQPKRILSFNNMQQQINQVVVSLDVVKQIEENSNNNNNNNNNNKCSDDDSDETEDDEFDEFSEKKTNPCPICGKLISNKGNLKVHLETHRPKGRYACDICGRIFKTQCNLYRHKKYHGGVQYPCGVCGRVYPTNSTLRAHSITHSDLRPHGCPMCDKTFKRNQDLKFHINQHTGARPYQCPYCPKAFASSGNCFSHRKRMHPLEVERDRERAAKIMR